MLTEHLQNATHRLIVGIENNNWEVIHKALELGARFDVCSTESMRCALHALSMPSVSVATIQMVIPHLYMTHDERPLDPDVLDHRGDTPFLQSCTHANGLLFDFLIEIGANLFHQGSNGWNALHTCCAYGNLLGATKILQSAPELLDQEDASGHTPLHFACNVQHEGIVQLLLSLGANVNAQSDHYATPMHTLCENAPVHLADLLLSFGAKVALTEHRGFTPLHLAALNDHLPMVQWLMRQPEYSLLDITQNTKAASQYTVLGLARQSVRHGSFEYFESLLEHDALTQALSNLPVSDALVPERL